MTNVTFKHVSSSKCSESQARAKIKSLQAINGYIKARAVVTQGQSQLR